MTIKTSTGSSKSELSSRGKRPFKVFGFSRFFLPQTVAGLAGFNVASLIIVRIFRPFRTDADGRTDGRTAIFAAAAAAAARARRTEPRPRHLLTAAHQKKNWLRTAGRTKKKNEKIKVCLKR